jgi:hypothetical protein
MQPHSEAKSILLFINLNLKKLADMQNTWENSKRFKGKKEVYNDVPSQVANNHIFQIKVCAKIWSLFSSFIQAALFIRRITVHIFLSLVHLWY